MKKIGIISQVRMTSSRLPGKVLLPVKNKVLLKYHTDRLRESRFPVYLATTTNSTDDVIADFAQQEGIDFYRGDEDHVLSRYYGAARTHELDVIVRVTSDCPLIDVRVLAAGIHRYLEINNPEVYVSNAIVRTFARGFDFEIFSFDLLQNAFFYAQSPFEKEHVTPYIKAHARLEHIISDEDTSDLRITVDTPEDFELIKILIQEFEAETLNHQEITTILRKHPELVKINAHIEQKKI